MMKTETVLKTDCEIRMGFMSCLKDLKEYSWGMNAQEFDFAKWAFLQEEWFDKKGKEYGKDTVEYIEGILFSLKNQKISKNKIPEPLKQEIRKKITTCVRNNEPIEIVLPAFPFKTGNFARCTRNMPDIAELAALNHLWEMCRLVEHGYKPGLRFDIISDGISMFKAFNISPYLCNLYVNTLKDWTNKLGYSSRIAFYELTDLLRNHYPHVWDEILRVDEFIDGSETVPDEEFEQICESIMHSCNTYGLLHNVLNSYLHGENPGNDLLNTRWEDIKRGCFYYNYFWTKVRKNNVLKNLFPNAIKASSTKYGPERNLCLYIVSHKENILPWNGVGVVKSEGSLRGGIITTKYEYQIVNNPCYMPIYLEGEETPFGYIGNM